MDEMLVIREIRQEDIPDLAVAFQSWGKPEKLFAKYFEMHEEGLRFVVIGRFDKNIVGYCTITWESFYEHFRREYIPEIVDLNIIEAYQGRGFAKKLILYAEKIIKQKGGHTSGISCLPSVEYSSPQQIYMRTGYEPDGFGITDYDGEIHLIKKLSS